MAVEILVIEIILLAKGKILVPEGMKDRIIGKIQ